MTRCEHHLSELRKTHWDATLASLLNKQCDLAGHSGVVNGLVDVRFSDYEVFVLIICCHVTGLRHQDDTGVIACPKVRKVCHHGVDDGHNVHASLFELVPRLTHSSSETPNVQSVQELWLGVVVFCWASPVHNLRNVSTVPLLLCVLHVSVT